MKVSIVIPAFNEEESIGKTLSKVREQVQDFDHEIIVVDDGSNDTTLSIVKEMQKQVPELKYVSLSRNFGHQSALRAGLDCATGDCIISMDSDLQHPPETIPEMIKKWQEGYDIIYTTRSDSSQIGIFKKLTSSIFYKIQNLLSDVKIDKNAADFRLTDRRVVDLVKNSAEYDLFLRGFFSWVGFKQYNLRYTPNKRIAGRSKYTFKKMMNLAFNGITSFSIKPLRFSIIAGVVMALCAFLYLGFVVFVYFFTDRVISGWASIIASILLLGGIQLIVLGIIGEYLGRIFIQTKQRPSYIIRERSL